MVHLSVQARRSACTSQNYPTENLCEQSQSWLHFDTLQHHTQKFSLLVVKSSNQSLAHMSYTPIRCRPNGQIRKEITQLGIHNDLGISWIPPVSLIRIRLRTPSQSLFHWRHKWMTCANSRPDLINVGWPISIHYPLSIPVLFMRFRGVAWVTKRFQWLQLRIW